jgi:hypothetical protein
MSSFTEIFSFGSDDAEPEFSEEPRRPSWFGPPEDELGTVVPQGVVIAQSNRAVVALSHAVAYSTGASFDFFATARSLGRSEANRVFHEQHMFEEQELPATLLRIGFEFADGRRVSNLGGWHTHRKLMNPDAEPDGPLLLPHAGGGGNSGAGQVTMKPGYWLWPLPPSGPPRVSCEWPFVDIALTTVEIEGSTLLDASRHIRRLWR